MNKNTRAKYIKLLKEKRKEIWLMGEALNTKRKLLNIEIDILLEILDLDDSELAEINSEYTDE